MKKKLDDVLQTILKAPLHLSPRLNFLYIQQRRNRSLFRKPVETPWGFKLCGNRAMESGDFEQDEAGKIRAMLQDVDLFVNIGANIGYYACMAASMGKKVIAFEPDSANCNLLYKNIHLNGFDERVEVFPLALADRAGMLELFGLGTGASLVNLWNSKEEGVLVPVNVLDAVLAHRLENKKILFLVDVEGAENLVLRGAEWCLETDALWVMEITPPSVVDGELRGGARYEEVFRLFAEKGYHPALLRDGKV